MAMKPQVTLGALLEGHSIVRNQGIEGTEVY